MGVNHIKAAGSWSELAAGFRKTFDFSRVGAINWFPGHMTRGLRQMEHTMLKTDLIIEVHDARYALTSTFLPAAQRLSLIVEIVVGVVGVTLFEFPLLLLGRLF